MGDENKEDEPNDFWSMNEDSINREVKSEIKIKPLWINYAEYFLNIVALSLVVYYAISAKINIGYAFGLFLAPWIIVFIASYMIKTIRSWKYMNATFWAILYYSYKYIFNVSL